MEDIQKRITDIEKEIRETPYHKGTEHHIGLLRARLSKLKDQLIESGTKKSSGGVGGFAVKKQGDATVVLVGFPSVGKSTLLNKLTNASSRVAPYSFTTVTVIPGMMHFQGARIQILDVPGLIEGASSGKGRGREVLSVVRSADLLLIMSDAKHPGDFEKIISELDKNGVKVNEVRPQVEIRKTSTGGLRINFAAKQDISEETIKDICREFRVSNAEIIIKEKLNMERLIDAFSLNRIYIPALYILSKSDLLESANIPEDAIMISAEKEKGLEDLKYTVWEKLGMVRVYLKGRGGITDYEDPLIVNKSYSLNEVMLKVGNEFAENKKGAKIWGPGSRFPGQSVSLSTLVVDQMEVEFV
ncbi:MAG: small GTP-binding protein [Microgenomates group bacterium Gr01-1014_5]|nr:MAG: small GTP-binding protein [Microgenomates group bacterium Gr01-1014_5]